LNSHQCKISRTAEKIFKIEQLSDEHEVNNQTKSK